MTAELSAVSDFGKALHSFRGAATRPRAVAAHRTAAIPNRPHGQGHLHPGPAHRNAEAEGEEFQVARRLRALRLSAPPSYDRMDGQARMRPHRISAGRLASTLCVSNDPWG